MFLLGRDVFGSDPLPAETHRDNIWILVYFLWAVQWATSEPTKAALGLDGCEQSLCDAFGAFN